MPAQRRDRERHSHVSVAAGEQAFDAVAFGAKRHLCCKQSSALHVPIAAGEEPFDVYDQCVGRRVGLTHHSLQRPWRRDVPESTTHRTCNRPQSDARLTAERPLPAADRSKAMLLGCSDVHGVTVGPQVGDRHDLVTAERSKAAPPPTTEWCKRGTIQMWRRTQSCGRTASG